MKLYRTLAIHAVIEVVRSLVDMSRDCRTMVIFVEIFMCNNVYALAVILENQTKAFTFAIIQKRSFDQIDNLLERTTTFPNNTRSLFVYTIYVFLSRKKKTNHLREGKL